MDKKLLKVLLKLYFSEFRKAFLTTFFIFILISILFIFLGSLPIEQALLTLPIVMLLFGTILFGKQLSLYIRSLRDISKGRYESTYVTCKEVSEDKRSLFTRGTGALTYFLMVGTQGEVFRFCTVRRNINPAALQDFMGGRKWHITYLKKTRIILNIQLNNTVLKDAKRQKFEEEIAKASKEIFGTFGRK